MDNSTVAYLKKFIQNTLTGMGALQGKNCTIQSINTVADGVEVVFSWTPDGGTATTSTMIVPQGPQGLQGDPGPEGPQGVPGAQGP